MNVSTEEDMRPDGSESSSASHADVNGTHRESKLELFGFDSLVNILGLRSMTGEQSHAPSSPRDGEDVSIMLECPKDCWYGRHRPVLISRVVLLYVYVLDSGIIKCNCNKWCNEGWGAILSHWLGVSIGLCFFLGTAVAASLYVLGAVETFLSAVPSAGIFTVIMFLISWSFSIVSLALACLIYKYVCIKGKAGDWGDGFKSAYFQLALRSLRSLGANQVHAKNWYPIPLIFCRPWGKLPENVPCHPKLADFANCVKKKGRGMSIFVSILDGDYLECAEDAKIACQQLSTYIEYKQCEGVAEVVVAPYMSAGFRGIVQTMGLGNLKPNIVVMRYPEIWRRENLIEIPSTIVGIINDCIVANKAVVIVKGLEEWPNVFQRQFGTIDLYWIVRDGGLMLLLSQLLLTKESFENCKIQVFCIAEEETDAEGLKGDVKKFLYDLRMQAEVIVITIKTWDVQVDGGSAQDESIEAFTAAQRRVADYMSKMKETAEREGTPLMADGKPVIVNEQQVEKFLYTTLKLNSTMLRYSRMAAVVLVSLPPPPLHHPSIFYMEYLDLLVENIPRLLIVRGYRKDVVTLFT
uniref:SLC12A transporter C-terminal domain-containing protein n=1 Tax=Chenopodium quinoa TaxID=63459 RepID=A0A803MSL1_CHEQI